MRTLLLYLFLLLFANQSFSQHRINQNLKGFDDKQTLHFGFYVGLNYLGANVNLNDKIFTNDTIFALNVRGRAGFNLGVITDLHLGPHFDLRLLFPTLIFGQRDFEYQVKTDRGIFTDVRVAESTYLSAPLEVKWKTERYGNFRAYVLGGGEIGYDMVSQKNVDESDKSVIRLNKWDYNYAAGFGFEFFFEYFKFAPQFKWSFGLNNLMVNDGTPFTDVVDQVRSRTFLISLTFEGGNKIL